MGGINTGLLVVRIEVLKGGIPCIGYRGKCDTNRIASICVTSPMVRLEKPSLLSRAVSRKSSPM
jgi:hypothetical protein